MKRIGKTGLSYTTLSVLIACAGYFFCVSKSAESLETGESIDIPEGFMIGAGGSAYQIEGAWNESDKGISTWDVWSHKQVHLMHNGTNGDVATDFYHRYKDDIRLAKELGFNHYRMSLSWTRILPSGFANNVSSSGIEFYKNVLDEIRAQGMEPFVTICHWDHPAVFDNFGGWLNELMVDFFVDYARVVFRELGSRVKIWTTINEPNVYCNIAYGPLDAGYLAPGQKIPGRSNYLCGHNFLKAHAKTYHLYDKEFRKSQGGLIGTNSHCGGAYAAPNSRSDTVLTALAFDCGWLSHPIYSKTGDYPEVMKKQIKENSLWEGHAKSRLPKFTKKEIDMIRGTADYIGFNYYTSKMMKGVPKRSNDTPWVADTGLEDVTSSSGWKQTKVPWIYFTPEGFKVVFKYIADELNAKPNLPIYILENGIFDVDGYDDVDKIEYLYAHIKEVIEAVKTSGVNVKAYSIWSLIDNYEWDNGFSKPFGFYKVDFNDPNLTRTPRLSAKWIKKVLESRKLFKYNKEMLL